MKKIIFIFFLFLFFLPFLQAEEITLTTYYPSPSGIYRRLELDGIAGQADLHFHGEGSISSDQELHLFAGPNENFIFSFGGDTLATSTEAVTIMDDGRVDARCVALSYGDSSGTTECPPSYNFNQAITPAASSTGGYFFCCRAAH